MSKTKEQVMTELKAVKARKEELTKLQKSGNTSEEVRTELAKCEADLLALSEDMKVALTQSAQPEVKVVEKAVEKTAEKLTKTVETEVSDVEKYVTEDEKHLVHARLTKGIRFDPATGKEISEPYIQKFSVQEFKTFTASAAALGFNYEILHEPSK